MLASFVDVVVNGSKDTLTDISHAQQGNYQSEHQLLKIWGYAEQQTPVGDFLRVYHGLSGRWCVASPMRWEATHNDVVMRKVGVLLSISEEESRQLFLAFANFLKEDGIHMHYHDATTWLIEQKPVALPTVVPAYELLDKSMSAALRTLMPEASWLRLVTESQMFFSAQKQEMNGLWFWGGGACMAPQKRPLIICADERWHQAASCLSSCVQVFDEHTSCVKNSVYFIPDLTQVDLTALEYKLRRYWVRWHWNNMTYMTRPHTLLAKLLHLGGFVSHAY
jgi:hypothetical protein